MMKLSDHLSSILHSIVVLLLVFSLFKQPKLIIDGYSSDEVNYLLEIQKLKQDKSRLFYDIEKIKTSIKADSVFIHNASNKQIDSLFSDYLRHP